jgi:hypothetical protein
LAHHTNNNKPKAFEVGVWVAEKDLIFDGEVIASGEARFGYSNSCPWLFCTGHDILYPTGGPDSSNGTDALQNRSPTNETKIQTEWLPPVCKPRCTKEPILLVSWHLFPLKAVLSKSAAIPQGTESTNQHGGYGSHLDRGARRAANGAIARCLLGIDPREGGRTVLVWRRKCDRKAWSHGPRLVDRQSRTIATLDLISPQLPGDHHSACGDIGHVLMAAPKVIFCGVSGHLG